MSFPLDQPLDLTVDTYSDPAYTTLGDPDLLTITVRDPNAADTVHTWPGDVTRLAVGKFKITVADDISGFWLAHAEATGAVTTAQDYGWEVGAGLNGYPWRPDLATVATYISERTVTVTAPGVQEPVGTFTADTTPTAEQALVLIEQATRYVITKVGTVAVTLYEPARDAAAMRAAGLIELAYPSRDADLNVGDRWLKLADDAITGLRTANSNPGAATPDALLPVYSFPDPPPYADIPI